MQFEQSGHFLSPWMDHGGRLYGERDEGFISFSDVSSNLLGMEGQYGSRYIVGDLEGYPALGRGLRFNGLNTTGYTHHAIGIHPDDIEEFRRRLEAYRAYERGSVEDKDGERIELNEAALQTLRTYLDSFSAYRAWER